MPADLIFSAIQEHGDNTFQFFEVILAETPVEFQSFIIRDKSFGDEFTQCLRRPDAKLRGFGAADAVADGDDGIATFQTCGKGVLYALELVFEPLNVENAV